MLKEYPYRSQLLVLLLSTFLCVAVYVLRVQHTQELYFLFLSWNLFLAWVPYIISSSLIVFQVKKPWIQGIFFCLWLLFLPNSPYIITDFFHLRPREIAPYWLDLTLLSCFAWTGLLLGLTSIQHMHRHVFQKMGNIWAWICVMGILFLSSFGVYLGRFNRWNSWDLMTQPEALFSNIADLLLHPTRNAVGFTFAFGAFLLVCYLAYFFKEHSPKEAYALS